MAARAGQAMGWRTHSISIEAGHVHARQFPRGSGYPEDAATGIAAAALFYGVGAPAQGLVVHQGEAMGRPSAIHVRRDPEGRRLSGRVEMMP